MAEFTHDESEYDEVDASVEAAGFTDWAAEHDIANVSSEQAGNNGDDNNDGDKGLLYYAESARGDQLIEVFISPLDRSEHTTVEDMVQYDETKYSFDWKRLMDSITSHRDEVLLISIINYVRRKTQTEVIQTSEQAIGLFEEILAKIDQIRSDDVNLQPQIENDALLPKIGETELTRRCFIL